MDHWIRYDRMSILFFMMLMLIRKSFDPNVPPPTNMQQVHDFMGQTTAWLDNTKHIAWVFLCLYLMLETDEIGDMLGLELVGMGTICMGCILLIGLWTGKGGLLHCTSSWVAGKGSWRYSGHQYINGGHDWSVSTPPNLGYTSYVPKYRPGIQHRGGNHAIQCITAYGHFEHFHRLD